jgi:hypothetical protein
MTDQERMEKFYRENLPDFMQDALDKNKKGEYISEFGQLAWDAWQAAQSKGTRSRVPRKGHPWRRKNQFIRQLELDV